MAPRRLLPLCLLLSLASPTLGQVPQPQAKSGPIMTVGHLIATAPAETKQTQVPYIPQPGDVVVYDDFNRFFHLIFKLSGTAPPTHAAMVIARADGKPALLELTGPHVVTAHVRIMDVEERFQSYPGTVMVRRVRQPLTPEHSQELTKFAEAQVGKGFALPRVCLQITPFTARTGLRKELFGRTYPTRQRWFCSELVVSACAACKLVDGNRCCGNATYPRDLAFDEFLDLSATHHPPLLWSHGMTTDAPSNPR